MHGGGSAPSCCAFTHRVAFEHASHGARARWAQAAGQCLQVGHCGPWPLAADLPLRRAPLRALCCLRPASCSAGRPGHTRRAHIAPPVPARLPGSRWVPGLGSEPGENRSTCVTRAHLGTEQHSFKRVVPEGERASPPWSPGTLAPEGDLPLPRAHCLWSHRPFCPDLGRWHPKAGATLLRELLRP